MSPRVCLEGSPASGRQRLSAASAGSAGAGGAASPEAEDASESESADCFRERIRLFMQVHLLYSVSVIVLAGGNGYARACGDIEGNPLPHFCAALYGVGELSLHGMRWCGAVSPSRQLYGHTTLVRLGGSGYACLALLTPSNGLVEIVFGGIFCQTFADVIVIGLMLYASIELGVNVPVNRAASSLQVLPFICSIIRSQLMPGSGETAMAPAVLTLSMGTCLVSAFFIMNMGEVIKGNFLRMRCSLRSEVARTKAAVACLEQSKAELENLSHGMSRMLKALCDVVVYLDSGLCIQNPSGQLQELLLPSGSGASGEGLHGRSLLDFVDSAEDKELVHAQLGLDGLSGGAEPGGTSSGAAGAFSIRFRSWGGGCCSVQIFYVRLGASADRAGCSLLLGLQVDSQADRAPSSVGDEAFQDLDEMDSPVAGAPLVDIVRDCDKAPQVSSVDDGEVDVNPSRIAVHFDASSDAFSVVGSNPLLGPAGDLRLKPQSLLEWVEDPDGSFETWVVKCIQNSPWDRSTTSEPFSRPVRMLLPRVRTREVAVSKLWLDMNPPDEDGEIEATLWLEGISVEKPRRSRRPKCRSRGKPLTTVQEELHSSSDEETRSQGASSKSSDVSLLS